MGDTATFVCGQCGKVASTVTLVSPGQPDPRLTPDPPGSPPGIGRVLSDFGFCQLSIAGGPVSVTLGPVLPDKVLVALEAGDAGALYAVNSELAPFWCPGCSASYCGEHFVATTIYDEGFFDYIKGVCPNGHERTLED